MEEIWKPIKDYEDLYEVSDTGRIRSISRDIIGSRGRKKKVYGRVLKTRLSRGYPMISIDRLLSEKNYIRKGFSVHRLVAKAFIPNPNNLPQVNHKNGIKTDNRVENLEWVTRKENAQHAVRTGLMGGEKINTARITTEQAREIKILLSQAQRPCDIARVFKIPRYIVYFIAYGKSWKYVTI